MIFRIALIALLFAVLAGCSGNPAPAPVKAGQQKNLPPEVTGDPPAKPVKKKR